MKLIKNKNLLFLIIFNMLAGNIIIALTIASAGPLAGKLACHFVFSLVALFLIIKLNSIFQKKIYSLFIIALTVISSFLVPVLSLYLIIAGFGLYEHELKGFLIGIPFSLIAGGVSFPLWLPLGLINSVCFVIINRKARAIPSV